MTVSRPPAGPRPRRMLRRLRAGTLLVVAAIVAACTGGGEPSTSATGAPPAGGPLTQAWATATLVDVTTGEPFRIADVAEGRVVFVETMAIWCTNCRTQQATAKSALEGLDADRVGWIVLDVESSESAEALAAYREQHGFPFTYAVADQAFSRALAGDFGDVVLSPPSVNIIVIGADGRVSHSRGHLSADDIQRLAAEHGA